MRDALIANVHKLSGVFAETDADGDGVVTCTEFRAVLPVLEVEGATAADAEAVFYNLSKGAPQMNYRDLFLELTRIEQQQRHAPPQQQP